MDDIVFYILIGVASVIVILNIIASYIVCKTLFIVKGRRFYQLLFIWLVPFIGAILAIYLNCEEYFNQKKEKQIGNLTSITDREAVNHAMGADHHGGR